MSYAHVLCLSHAVGTASALHKTASWHWLVHAPLPTAECWETPAMQHTTMQDTPVADAKPDDIKDLLGGALFKALFKWMQESGPVYLLPTGD